MSKENNEDVKRCLFCNKKILNNKDLICKRCWLQGKDIGEKVLGGLVVAGTTVLTVAAAMGNAKNNGGNDD